MEHRDKLSKHYESKLEDGYDCVDRIVLNAYCPMLLQGGGVRYWWRQLYGDDSTLASPANKGNKRLAGINIAQPRMQDVLQSVIALSIQPNGFAAKDLTNRMQYIGWKKYQPRHAAYDLRKLRGKCLVVKKGARKYANTPHGIQTIVALLSLIQNEFPKTFAILKND